MTRPVDIRETKQSEVLVRSLPTLTCPLAHQLRSCLRDGKRDTPGELFLARMIC